MIEVNSFEFCCNIRYVLWAAIMHAFVSSVGDNIWSWIACPCSCGWNVNTVAPFYNLMINVKRKIIL